MITPVLIAGFTMGLAGSLHCVGMCGPLSLALPTGHLSGLGKLVSLLLYQFGRIITYSFIGLVSGLAGRGLVISGYQQWFSIILGSIILLLAVLYFVQKKSLHFRFLNRFYYFIQQKMGRLLRSAKGSGGFMLLGIANGFLPCGMVYIAMAATLSLTSVGQSIFFMAAFGAGTLPAMMLVAVTGQYLKPGIRNSFRKAVPVFITLMGIVLILRGMNLGIPFISPELPNTAGTVTHCEP